MSQTNITLKNLNMQKLHKILLICEEEDINYTFLHNYNPDELFDHYNMLEELLLADNKKIPKIFEKLMIDYKRFMEFADDTKDNALILKKLKNIKYE